MKKLFLTGAIVIAMLTIFGLQDMVQAAGEKSIGGTIDGCNACYKKQNGQLRLISSSGKCLKSEKPINLCQGDGQSNGSGTGELACVTGALGQVAPSNGEILITSMKNIEVSDASEVFYKLYSSPIFVDDITWGLYCNEAWVNTGCNSVSNLNEAYDLVPLDNGCRSDDEEYYNRIIFTTCCKIVESTQ